jgi:hypothetical protein
MDMLETSTSAYSGWSSSYSIGSLLLQMQSTLFDERALVEGQGGITVDTALNLARACVCRCGHLGTCVKPPFPNLETLRAKPSVVVARPALAQLFGLVSPSVQMSRPCSSQVENKPSVVNEQKSDSLSSMAETKDEEEAWCVVRRKRDGRKNADDAKQIANEECKNIEDVDNVSQVSTADSQSGSKTAWGIPKKMPLGNLTLSQLRNARRGQKRAGKRLQLGCSCDGCLQEVSPAATPVEPVCQAVTAIVIPKAPLAQTLTASETAPGNIQRCDKQLMIALQLRLLKAEKRVEGIRKIAQSRRARGKETTADGEPSIKEPKHAQLLWCFRNWR